MQIPLKRGRLFTEQEAKEMRHVVVVNETFARKNLPGQDPLGKRVTINMKDENVPTEIIGVVGDTKHLGLDTEDEGDGLLAAARTGLFVHDAGHPHARRPDRQSRRRPAT